MPKNEKQNSSFDNARISWIAPESYRHERGIIWKIVMGLILTATVGLGIYYGAWTFSLALATAVIVYFILHKDGPKDVKIIISDMGVKVGNRKYSYNNIKGFWVVYEPPRTKTIYIKVTNDLALDIPLLLEDQDPSEVRKYLIQRIPELENQGESLIDIYQRLLKL